MYEVTIKCPTPAKPEGMTDRMWLANIKRLGFVLGGDWVVGVRSTKAVWRVESDGRKIVEGFIYRNKDTTWAIEQALRWWRAEIRLLLDTEELDWQYGVTASARSVPLAGA